MANFFPKNLAKLRENKQLTQAETATALVLNRSTYANYENGVTEPDFLTIERICLFFGMDAGTLLFTDITEGNLSDKIQDSKKNADGNPNGKGLGNPNDKKGTEKEVITPFKKALNVYDLDSKAAAGMALLLDDGDKLKTAPNLYLPSIGTGMHIRIPISGDSMDKTIKNGDKVVAVRVLEETSFRDGDVYVIMTNDNEVLCKRVYRDGKYLELISDNENYAPLKLHHNKVLAIFRVKEVHSTDLRPYSTDIRREMAKMGHEIALIRQQLSKK